MIFVSIFLLMAFTASAYRQQLSVSNTAHSHRLLFCAAACEGIESYADTWDLDADCVVWAT